MNIFVADPGYSLKEGIDKWEMNNFPGHALYGVNHFKENNMEPIFQEKGKVIKEQSKGANKLAVAWSRVISEISLIKEVKSKKNIDAIYVPLMNFGLGICIARKFKLISGSVTIN